MFALQVCINEYIDTVGLTPHYCILLTLCYGMPPLSSHAFMCLIIVIDLTRKLFLCIIIQFSKENWNGTTVQTKLAYVIDRILVQ